MTGKRRSSIRDIDWIRKILEASPEPLSAGEIAEAIREGGGPSLKPDQVKYRIRLALKDIEPTGGKTRGAKYRSRQPGYASNARIVSDLPASAVRTPEAAELLTRVSADRSRRKPVTYRREWLDSYKPGVTWYLPGPLRAHLRALATPSAAHRPAGSFARDIYQRLLIDLSWASSRLEGNTYNRLDTQNLIEFGEAAEGKDIRETRMILNHKKAIDLLVATDRPARLDPFTVRALHAELSADLLHDSRHEGLLRRTEVSINGSVYVPTAVPQLIEECFGQILETAQAIPDPIECSFFLLVHLPYLQPFIDVNKRTARLAANIPLLTENLCPLSFVDVPEREYILGHLAVYELNGVELLRDVFAWAYERSCQQYRAVHEAITPPNPIRLRYRDALARAIAAAVRSGGPPNRAFLHAEALRADVPHHDADAFAETAFELLLNLHDVTATRYGLTPEEFVRWRATFPSPNVPHP